MHIEIDPHQVDWDALHALLVDTYRYMDGRIDPPSSLHRMSAADLRAKAGEERLIVAAADDGRLIGCLFCRPEDDWLYVGKMAVAADLQGAGIGRHLIEGARSMARERHLRGLELETRIELTENHEAFGRMGFVKVADQSHEGYSRVTNIRMRAPLPS